jgi:hypothetical protein
LFLTHDHYEELCALAALGQLSGSDLTDLSEHVQTCAACSVVLRDLGQFVAQGLPAVIDELEPTPVPEGMTQRFVARARSEHLSVTAVPPAGALTLRTTAKSIWSRKPLLGLATAAAVLPSLLWLASQGSIQRVRRLMWSSERLTTTNHSSPVPVGSTALLARMAELEKQLKTAEGERDSLAAKVKVREIALDSTSRAKLEMEAHLTLLEKDVEELHRLQAQRDAGVVQLNSELVSLRSESKANRDAASVEEADLNSLRHTVEKQAEELKESRQLAAAADQAKDLIVARNLHIVDVHDADESGNRQRAFGRIFYTEGKSLVFYAYDLKDSRKLDARISFHVWGEKLGASQAVKSLGIFHTDSESDSRWILTFDDPHVLAQINTVFVTVESGKKSVTQPSGKKILYAFLGQANHP